MRLANATLPILTLLSLTACAPAFNWREASIDATPLAALFPCKPKRATRAVPIDGQSLELHMTACDTAGVTLAIGSVRLDDASRAGAAMAQWRDATMAAMRAGPPTPVDFAFALAKQGAKPVLIRATGTRPDGTPVAMQGAWFFKDQHVFAALLYAETLPPDVADTFFNGLRFQ